MKTYKLLTGVSVCALSLALVSCSLDCEKGRGAMVSEQRDVAAFTAVKLDIPAELVISQSDLHSCRIEAQANLLPLIKTDISRGSLTISSDGCISSSEGIKVYVSALTYEQLSIDGSGAIRAQGPLNTPSIKLAVQGSGTIQMELNADVVYSGIKGSGGIMLSGTAKQHFSRLDGSGSLEAVDLATTKTEITTHGSASAMIFAIESIKADLNGSGEILYKGTPAINSKLHGSGEIRRIAD